MKLTLTCWEVVSVPERSAIVSFGESRDIPVTVAECCTQTKTDDKRLDAVCSLDAIAYPMDRSVMSLFRSCSSQLHVADQAEV